MYTLAFFGVSFLISSYNPRTLLPTHFSADNENVDDTLKSKSSLAQLAEDWLDEEEDELQKYWERFDDKKKWLKKEVGILLLEDDESITTEQRLERYYDRCGINKVKEKEYSKQIEEATKRAKYAKTPEQAIAALQAVQPWLQVNTRMGGMALYELAIALWQRDGEPDEALLQELVGNPSIKAKVLLLLKKNAPPSRRGDTSLWQGLLGRDIWWD